MATRDLTSKQRNMIPGQQWESEYTCMSVIRIYIQIRRYHFRQQSRELHF